jgi:protein-disulfide isomerase
MIWVIIDSLIIYSGQIESYMREFRSIFIYRGVVMSDRTTSRTSKRKALRLEREKRQKRQRITTLLIIIGVALIVVALLVYPTLKQSLTPVGEIVKVTPQPRPMASFNSTGDPNAPVKLIEYSDFQCPYCKLFSDQTEKRIVDNYIATGKVYYTYVPFGPGGNYIGQESKDAAMAAFCAGDQGKFWEYHDILFANQTGENVGDFTEKRLMAMAEALGLDLGKFQSCYKSQQFETQLAQGISEGLKAGIGGTPSFLVNGQKIEGAQPYDAFQQAIEAALAASGK